MSVNERTAKERRAIDGRELFGQNIMRRRSPFRDRFGRMIQAGDIVLSPAMAAAGLPFQIVAVTPAAEPGLPPGSAWLELQCRSRILVQGGVPMEDVLLLMPGKEQAEDGGETTPEARDAGKPGEARTPGGIILSDPDGMSER